MNQLYDKIAELSDEALRQYCEDLYDMHYVTGELKGKELRVLLKELRQNSDITVNDVEYALLDEAIRRFKKTVIYLIRERPGQFFISLPDSSENK